MSSDDVEKEAGRTSAMEANHGGETVNIRCGVHSSCRCREPNNSGDDDQRKSTPGGVFNRNNDEDLDNYNYNRSNNPQSSQLNGSIRSGPESAFGSSGLDRDEPGDWVIGHHLRNLITRLKKPQNGRIGSAATAFGAKIREIQCGPMVNFMSPSPSSPGDGPRFRISFAEVQRMRIRKLQCQLVRHVVKMRHDGHESPGWEQTIEQYSMELSYLGSFPEICVPEKLKALQDYDYMEHRSKSIRDPFLATGEYGVDNYVLNCNIDGALADDITVYETSLKPWDINFPHYNAPAESSPETGSDDDDTSQASRSQASNVVANQSTQPITGTRGRNVANIWYRGFRDRIVIALAGGAFLVGPMWLMVLNSGLYATLISATAFVGVFGILMAYFLEEGKDVLGSTAAYAAVLVVFVGTSNV